ncbi:MAG: antibiotic biosynthesis monooxygenase [Sporolactobacillus sp.]|jgi:quinol monooxygenase YgiN|nr:antibiotic biosynthesis monooxygenase [Sporolactobacillus sp.]MCI1882137.1 antibiotic biosynthesis monooxygenase [Sporolactobacillus sp.]
MIIIHALFYVAPEMRENFLNESVPLIAGSRDESGNIDYALYEEVSAPNCFIMIEKWKSMQDVKAHQSAPHYVSFNIKAESFLARPVDVSIYRTEEKTDGAH